MLRNFFTTHFLPCVKRKLIMANIHNLPMDIWHYILDYLSLDDLVRITSVFDSTASAAFQITKRRAIKVISDLVINGTPRAQVIIAGNGACYKFQEKYPRAGPYRHRRDHPQNRPCGGVHNPGFFPPVRTLHRHADDDHKMEMILYFKEDKFGQVIDQFWPLSYPAGPAEMISLTFRFSANPPDSDDSGDLYVHFDTLSEDIDDTFTDISNSLFRSTRTIIHNIPLRGAFWLVRKREKTVIPLDWLGFLGSEISAMSTFSKELVNHEILQPRSMR